MVRLTWEYNYQLFSTKDVALDDRIEIMDKLGEQGWELVSAYLTGAGSQVTYLFKRPGSPPAEEEYERLRRIDP